MNFRGREPLHEGWGATFPDAPPPSLPPNGFPAAGVYNIAWGIFSACDPQWLFRFAGMPLANHPGVFACLGMVIGLYGILYLEVARVPERGWLIAAVGLAGKILGPIGLTHPDRPAASGRSRPS